MNLAVAPRIFQCLVIALCASTKALAVSPETFAERFSSLKTSAARSLTLRRCTWSSLSTSAEATNKSSSQGLHEKLKPAPSSTAHSKSIRKGAVASVDPSDDTMCLRSFNLDLYTFVLFSDLGNCNDAKKMLDDIAGLAELPSVVEVQNECLEAVVIASYLPILRTQLITLAPGCHICTSYDPLEPQVQDVETWNYEVAKIIATERFIKRAVDIMRGGWPYAAAFYSGVHSKAILVLGYFTSLERRYVLR